MLWLLPSLFPWKYSSKTVSFPRWNPLNPLCSSHPSWKLTSLTSLGYSDPAFWVKEPTSFSHTCLVTSFLLQPSTWVALSTPLTPPQSGSNLLVLTVLSAHSTSWSSDNNGQTFHTYNTEYLHSHWELHLYICLRTEI